MTQLLYGSVLQQLGLSVEQAEIYELLLSTGPLSAMEIGKQSRVQRTYVYSVTQAMIEMGILTQVKQGKTTLFMAQSPDTLLSLVARQKQEAEQAERSLEGVLPLLKTMYVSTQEKPVVTYYEGIEGVKRAYNDTINEGKPLLALVETSKVHPEVYSWVTTDYSRRRIEAGILVKSIVASGPKTQQYVGLNEKELRETKVIDSAKFPLEHEVIVYGSKVAIINHHKDQPMLGIIIDNQAITSTFRSWFELSWSELD